MKTSRIQTDTTKNNGFKPNGLEYEPSGGGDKSLAYGQDHPKMTARTCARYSRDPPAQACLWVRNRRGGRSTPKTGGRRPFCHPGGDRQHGARRANSTEETRNPVHSRACRDTTVHTTCKKESRAPRSKESLARPSATHAANLPGCPNHRLV